MRRRSLVWRTITSAYCSSAARSSPDHRPELAPQPLGRELDRRQRVLHLVRDAPRHVAPGRHALRHHEVGHVVEGDDIALEPAVVRRAAPRRAPGGRARAPLRRSRTSAWATPALRASSRCSSLGELGHRLDERPAGRGLAGRGRGAPPRRRSSSRSARRRRGRSTPAVTPESTESNSRRRRSVSALAAISASRWPFTWRVISLKVRPSSAISSSPFSSRTRTSRSPCPTRSAAAGQPPDRPRQPLGEPEPHPHRGEDHHQREAEIDQRELEEEPPAVRLELLVEPHRLLGLVEQAQDLAVDLAADVEEVVGEGRELRAAPRTRCSPSPG